MRTGTQATAAAAAAAAAGAIWMMMMMMNTSTSQECGVLSSVAGQRHAGRGSSHLEMLCYVRVLPAD